CSAGCSSAASPRTRHNTELHLVDLRGDRVPEGLPVGSGSRQRGGRRPEMVACPLLIGPPAGSVLEPPLPKVDRLSIQRWDGPVRPKAGVPSIRGMLPSLHETSALTKQKKR